MIVTQKEQNLSASKLEILLDKNIQRFEKHHRAIINQDLTDQKGFVSNSQI